MNALLCAVFPNLVEIVSFSNGDVEGDFKAETI